MKICNKANKRTAVRKKMEEREKKINQNYKS